MDSNVRNHHEKIKFEHLSLAPYSNIRCGGSAEYAAIPKTGEELRAALLWAADQNLGVTVIGGGTNSLVSDRGIDGVTILTTNLTELNVQGGLLIAQSGVLFDQMIDFAIDNSLGGLEPLGGLPGTVGGAIAGNSGANGVLTGDLLYWVDCFDRSGRLIRLRAHPDSYSYRHSPFVERNDLVIWEAAFRLNPITKTNEARRSKEEFKQARLSKGQYRYPSIGCIFKNPASHGAGRIIDSCGLKGYTLGGAQVSSSHANFIINADQRATSDEVKALIDHIKTVVQQKTQIVLEEEIRYLGRWQ